MRKKKRVRKETLFLTLLIKDILQIARTAGSKVISETLSLSLPGSLEYRE